MKRLIAIILPVALIGLIGLSCSLEGYQSKQMGGILDKSTAANAVNIKDNSFQPSTLTVPAGTTVTWHNQDGVQHSVVSVEQGLFDSGQIAPGKDFPVYFSEPGTYKYYCSTHPSMQGVIVVTETSALQETTAGSEHKTSGSSGSGRSASWSESPIIASTASAALSQGVQGSVQTRSLQQQSQDLGNSESSGLAAYIGSGQSSITGQSTDQSSLEKFSQYYRFDSEASNGQSAASTKLDQTGSEPAMVYFGSTQKAVSYSQYKSYALSTGVNSLWIQGISSWSQYAMVPLGSMLTLKAISPEGGWGYLYEIYPDGTLNAKKMGFYSNQKIDFYADQVGSHQLFFNIESQPSNVIVIDVEPYQQSTQSTYCSVTVASSWLEGYTVYVDGNYAAREGMNGAARGYVTFSVSANQYHTIAVYGDSFTFSDSKYFGAGNAYQLNL
jgi:plastocyanin